MKQKLEYYETELRRAEEKIVEQKYVHDQQVKKLRERIEVTEAECTTLKEKLLEEAAAPKESDTENEDAKGVAKEFVADVIAKSGGAEELKKV